MALTVDTRTATEYGVVRTFGQGDFQFNNFGNNNPNNAFAFPGGASNALNTPGGGYVAVEMVFIQFAGFTFGKSASAYATPWHGYPGNNNSFLLGGHDTVTGVNNIQYTAQFGNGVSGTIGLDDPTVFNRTSLLNLGVAATPAGPSVCSGWYPGHGRWCQRLRLAPMLPTLSATSASIRLGVCSSFRLRRHLVNASYNVLSYWRCVPTNLSEISGHPDDKWGGSVMAALQIKNIPWGAGDDFKIDASYAKGDTKNVISTSAASPSFAMFGGSGRPGAYQSIGFGQTADAVFLPGFLTGGLTGDIKLVESYGVRGAYNHNWDPYWSSSLSGSYSAVRYDGNATRHHHCQGSVLREFQLRQARVCRL